jgi:heat shock protein HtpX
MASSAGGGRAAPSLAGRFTAAIALTIAFYVLALAIALALIGLPVYGWVEAGRGNVWVTIFGVVTGLTILAAIVPRRLPFTPPGPTLEASDQPRLIAAVEEVARDVGQELPGETYATLEVNAAVAEVSNGFLRGRRRVLIIGLPLLHLLSERGFRGVLAHEFGHYAGGDTRLGPWIWRTRETIGRTIDQLTGEEEDSWSERAVRAPFIWYGRAFLRITNAISRRQEFAADAVAAREVGRDAHVEALRRVHALAPGFDVYWADEVVPVLSSGHRPPVLAGFSGFVRAERIRTAASAHLERELAEARADPYDSHPTLAERIAAVRECPAGAPDESPPAHSLLDGEAALEQRALAHLGAVDELAPITWEDAADRVWLAGYRDLVAGHRELLDGITVSALGQVATEPEPIATALRQREPELAGEQAVGFARHLLGASLALALVRSGWRAEALPGDALSVVSGGDRIVPSDVVAALAAGETTPDAWRERAVSLGIADADLGQSAPEPARAT